MAHEISKGVKKTHYIASMWAIEKGTNQVKNLLEKGTYPNLHHIIGQNDIIRSKN
jgi:hypothetical protein